MAERNRIIDYIIEQADRYDIKNLQFEDDLKFQLNRLTDRYNTIAINKVIYDIESVYSLTKLISSIEKVIKEYVSQCEKIMLDKFTEYYKIAYDNTGDLIDLGNELQGLAETDYQVLHAIFLFSDMNDLLIIQMHGLVYIV